MKFEVTRRDVMRFAGGAAVGVALSPMPWVVTDDLAIWTQNWSWIPRPPDGERTTRATRCALCPAGCPLEAHSVGGSPVALRASAGSRGLCPPGLTAHQLPWHPARLARPVRQGRGAARPVSTSVEAVVRETAAALSRARAGAGATVVLDTRPGRSASWAWRRLLGGIDGATVVAAPGLDGSSFLQLGSSTGDPARELVIDPSGATTILSFGAPIAEGWGGLRDTLPAGVRLVQVEPMRSPTAEAADHWLPARPGSEGALALGIANIVIAEGLVDDAPYGSTAGFDAFAAAAARFPLARTAAVTGLAPDDIEAAARELATGRPTAVVAGEQPGGGALPRPALAAIFGLGCLLGAHGLCTRESSPFPEDSTPLAPERDLASLDDASVSLLVVDASAGGATFPWPLVERKLARGALVVALSPFFAGSALHADLVVATAPFPEALHELPSGRQAALASLALAAPLLEPRPGTVDPVAFVRALAAASRIDLGGDWATTEALARMRVARIHAAGRGRVITSATDAEPVTTFASSDDLWDALLEGARWEGERPAPVQLASVTLGAGLDVAAIEAVAAPAARSRVVKVVPRAARDTVFASVVSPVLSKLYQETGLRHGAGCAALNPRTAAALGFAGARSARILTAGGSARVALACDEGVMPGVVELAVAPDARALGQKERPGARAAIDLLVPSPEGCWSSLDAELVEG